MPLSQQLCALGYTASQLEAVLGDDAVAYRAWAVGKTRGVCVGLAPCTTSHGIVDYSDDVIRFVRSH